MGGVFARRARIVALDAQGTAEDDRVLTKAILERIRSGQKPFALVCIYDQGLLFYFPCLHLQWIEEGSLELLDPLRRESARAHSKKAHALPVSPDLIQQFIQMLLIHLPAVHLDRQRHIFRNIQNRNQIVKLIDQSHLTPAENSQLLFVLFIHILPIHKNLSAGWAVYSPQNVK